MYKAVLGKLDAVASSLACLAKANGFVRNQIYRDTRGGRFEGRWRMKERETLSRSRIKLCWNHREAASRWWKSKRSGVSKFMEHGSLWSPVIPRMTRQIPSLHFVLDHPMFPAIRAPGTNFTKFGELWRRGFYGAICHFRIFTRMSPGAKKAV